MTITEDQAELSKEIVLDYTTWVVENKENLKGVSTRDAIDKYIETYTKNGVC